MKDFNNNELYIGCPCVAMVQGFSRQSLTHVIITKIATKFVYVKINFNYYPLSNMQTFEYKITPDKVLSLHKTDIN